MNLRFRRASLPALIGSAVLIAGTPASAAYTPETNSLSARSFEVTADAQPGRRPATTAGTVLLAQYGSVRRVSRRTSRRTSRRN